MYRNAHSPYHSRSRYDNYQNLIDHHIGHHIEIIQLTDIFLDQDTDHVPIHKEIRLDDIIIHIDPYLDLETLHPDHEHHHKVDNKTE